jgi:opacity protein-like surface antigen
VVGSGSSGYVAPQIDRKVDRYDSFSLGAKLGTTLGAYGGGGSYSDAGIGVAARYRLAEPIGLELAYNYSSSTDPDDPTRYTHMVQPSVQFFLFPWTRVSPYGTVGLTFDTTYDADRGVNGQAQPIKDSAWGAHAGLGIEFAIGDNLALDIEGRGIRYVEGHPDTLNTQLQTSVGLNYYF